MVGWCHQGEVHSPSSMKCFLQISEAAPCPPHSRPYHPYRWSLLSLNEYNCCIHTFVDPLASLTSTQYQYIMLCSRAQIPVRTPPVVIHPPLPVLLLTSLSLQPSKHFFQVNCPRCFCSLRWWMSTIFKKSYIKNRYHKKLHDLSSFWASYSSHYIACTIVVLDKANPTFWFEFNVIS